MKSLLQRLSDKLGELATPKPSAPTNRPETEYDKMLDKRAANFQRLLSIDKAKVLCLDIETTGLSFDNDEILQVSIIDGNNTPLFNSYIKPSRRKTWARAQEIHGISPDMVANKPGIEEVAAEVSEILSRAELIVGYNSEEFDIPFLRSGGVVFPESAEYYDMIKLFAVVYGDFSSYHGNYKYQKLETCAKHYGYTYNAHDALEDTKATLHCFYKLSENYANGGR